MAVVDLTVGFVKLDNGFIVGEPSLNNIVVDADENYDDVVAWQRQMMVSSSEVSSMLR